MTTSDSRRFPVGLTVATAIGLAVLIGLGVWQVQRLKWKTGLLARVAALQHAPAQPIVPVLARAARGQDVEFTRVWVDCGAGSDQAAGFRYGLEQGDIVWRALGNCRVDAPPFDGVLVYRGVSEAARGKPQPPVMVLAAPRHLIGVLRRPPTMPTRAELRHPAPFVLDVEQETPPAPGITASPFAVDMPNNHLGYAITWFGLAAALAGVYLAVLWRRLKPR